MRYTTCPKCSALVEPRHKRCPYCETDLRPAGAPSPRRDAEDTAYLGKVAILANTVLFLAAVMLDPTRADQDGFAFSPSGFACWMFGVGDYRMLVGCGQWWRLGTAMFLHLGLMHLAFNCFALLYVVPPAAHTFGRSRSLAIYLVTGLAVNVVSHYWFKGAGAGASGALSGMIAALAVWGWRRGGAMGDQLRRSMLVWMIYIFVFGLVLSTAGRAIDHRGHIAGFVIGAGLGWLASAVSTPRADRIWALCGKAAAVVVVAMFAFGLVPQVIRVFQRDDVVASSRAVKRTVERINDVRQNKADVASLPKTSPSVRGGSSSGRLKEAMDRLLRSMRAGERPRGEYDAVIRAWVVWKHELFCGYGIEYRK